MMKRDSRPPKFGRLPAADTGPSFADLNSFTDVPKPWKNPNYTKNAARRNKTLKQVLAGERDRAMGKPAPSTALNPSVSTLPKSKLKDRMDVDESGVDTIVKEGPGPIDGLPKGPIITCERVRRIYKGMTTFA